MHRRPLWTLRPTSFHPGQSGKNRILWALHPKLQEPRTCSSTLWLRPTPTSTRPWPSIRSSSNFDRSQALRKMAWRLYRHRFKTKWPRERPIYSKITPLSGGKSPLFLAPKRDFRWKCKSMTKRFMSFIRKPRFLSLKFLGRGLLSLKEKLSGPDQSLHRVKN